MRKTIIVIAALFITATTGLVSRAQSVQVEPGRYEIEVVLTGKVLDLKKEDMRTVQQYYRGKVNNQQWDIESAGRNAYYIRSAENKAYLSVEGARQGSRVVATNGARRGDAWSFVDVGNGNVMIVHSSGMTLDLTEGDTRDGAPIQVWSQAKNTHQQFKLVRGDTNAAGEIPNRTLGIENNEAYRMGVTDRAASLNSDYRRHRQMYDRNSEREFEQNYNTGYRASPTAGVAGGVENYEAYRLGTTDRAANLNSDYRRHRQMYDRNSERGFEQSYNTGYNSGQNTGNNNNNNNNDLSTLNVGQRRNYDDGYQLSQQDARSGSTNDYRRYSNRYNPRQESFFQRGYEAGYNSNNRNDRYSNERPNNDRYNNNNNNNDQFDLSQLSQNERRAYDDGYRLGQQDARSRSSLNYRRYNDRYNSRMESFFQRGYEAGYNNIRQ